MSVDGEVWMLKSEHTPQKAVVFHIKVISKAS